MLLRTVAAAGTPLPASRAFAPPPTGARARSLGRARRRSLRAGRCPRIRSFPHHATPRIDQARAGEHARTIPGMRLRLGRKRRRHPDEEEAREWVQAEIDRL